MMRRVFLRGGGEQHLFGKHITGSRGEVLRLGPPLFCQLAGGV